jgi:hypothetical protein
MVFGIKGSMEKSERLKAAMDSFDLSMATKTALLRVGDRFTDPTRFINVLILAPNMSISELETRWDALRLSVSVALLLLL